MKKRILAALSACILMTGCAQNQQAPAEPESAPAQEESTEQAQEAPAEPEQQEAEGGESAPKETLEQEDRGPRLKIDKWTDVIDTDTEGKEGDYKRYGTISIPHPFVEGEGFDELNKALEQDFEYRKEQTSWFRDTVKESLAYEEDAMTGYPWPYDETISIGRFDDVIFSYMTRASLYTGGAHGGVTLWSRNFDVKTGKTLELKDVTQDFEGFYDAVIEELIPRAEEFWDEWKDTVDRDVHEGDAENGAFGWVLDREGVTLTFGDYELGAYATGHVSVTIKDSDHPGLLKKDYLPKEGGLLCTKLEGYTAYYLDVDSDGTREVIFVEPEDMYDEDYTEVLSVSTRIRMGEEGASEDEMKLSEPADDLSYAGAYIMESAGGKYYLLVETEGYSDWNELFIYDINDPSKGAVFLDRSSVGSFYRYPPTDPERIRLTTRGGFLGTYDVYRDYRLGDDGSFEPLDEDYFISFYNPEDPQVLTVKEEFKAWDNREKSNPVTLKAGTKLTPVKTDNETFMVLTTDSDEIVCIFYDEEINEDTWERTIDGRPESELLDGIIWAS